MAWLPQTGILAEQPVGRLAGLQEYGLIAAEVGHPERRQAVLLGAK
jgi:hypothetical protein